MADQPSPVTFNCPACGSPLSRPPDGSTTMTCPACSNAIVIPFGMHNASASPDELRTRKKAILLELMRLVGSGKKIEAIKRYRQQFGVGLVEAKTAIDALEEGRGIDLPDPVAETIPESPPFRPYPTRVSSAEPLGNPFSPPKPRQRLSCGLLTVIGIVLAISIAAYGMMQSSFSIQGILTGSSSSEATRALPNLNPFARPPALLEPAILLPVSDSPSDIIAEARRYDKDPYPTSLVRISSANGQVVWETPAFPGKDINLDGLYTDGIRVFLAMDDNLIAYNAPDGKVLWQAKLSDKLNYCNNGKDCVLNYQSVVMILTKDDMLHALDATSGKQLWELRIASSSDGMHMYKDMLVIAVEDSKTKRDFIDFLDFKTGEEMMRITPQDYYYSYSPLNFGQDSLYFNTNSVMEKWDLSGSQPKLAWHKETDSFSPNEKGFLGKDTFYLMIDHGLNSVNLASGESTLFLQNEDYEFTPLSEQGDQLIVLARRTRGTEKFEIWPVNLQTREVGQTIAMGVGKLYDTNYETISKTDEFVWTWQVYNDVFYIVKFMVSPSQVSIDSYNLKTWAKTATQTLPLSKIGQDSYGLRSVIGWQRRYLFTLLETESYALDIEKGKWILTPP